MTCLFNWENIHVLCLLLALYRSHKYSISLSEGALHYLIKFLKVSFLRFIYDFGM